MNITELFETVAASTTVNRAAIISDAYDELRRIAERRMAGERANHTLSKTALVNEVSMKMLADERVPTRPDKFLAYASTAMRNLLIDYARSKRRQRRGGDRQKMALDEAITAAAERSDELVALNDALETLATRHPRKAKIVEMLYFGGMTQTEVATCLEVSLATVKREWVAAKVWLERELR